MDVINYLDLAIRAAIKAGKLQKERLWNDHDIRFKGEINLVTEVDRECEALIVDTIRENWSQHDILAEENDYAQSGSGFRWIIDPLDGTTNYAHGFPWFCVSIGLEAAGELVAGVVFNPFYDELFTATVGGGAFLNGHQLHVSSRSPLKETLLGTGFPYDCATDPANNFNSFIAFQKTARGIRRAGAAALDLASVAAGRLDGYWELKLKPWDMAAGVLLVREAGGMVTGFDGSTFALASGRVVASNGLIHAEMVAKLAGPAEEVAL